MDYYYLIILRVIHVTCTVFWAGATIYLAAFILPSVKALGKEGNRFMEQVVKTNKLPVVMTSVATLGILSGVLLIWKISGNFNKDWVLSLHGWILMIGALSGLVGYAVGFTINRAAMVRIAQVSKDIATQGGGPVPHQIQELNELQENWMFGTRLIAWLLFIAVIFMSLAHYI